MANHKSALKRIRSSEKKRVRNRLVRSKTRTEVKKARTAIQAGDVENARQATLEAIRTLDKAAVKGVLHRNNAARRKSRLMKRLAKLETQK
ncbi:MAG: 30S ribosomal protein S20 [Chloroflexi bacterium]|nr:30S ribosomal protein S20 [Chloroflexota bacterium]